VSVAVLSAGARPWPRVARPAVTAGVVVLAAALRMAGSAHTPLDPFYDAAVRSMGTSWHAFLVGAFEPSGRVAIDKPPVDLWLQVASTRLFGFTPAALLLPAALGGTLAVIALYDLLNTLAGWTTAVVGALALTVLPVAVLSARSDTMDAAMAALVVSAWAVGARGVGRGRLAHVAAAGALIGLAFEVKLFEALVGALPLALFWLLGAPRRRVAGLAAGSGAALVVGLAWLVLAPHAPWSIGSAHGSPWDAAFVYDGWDRISPWHHEAATNAAAAARVPAAAGPFRLLSAQDGLGPRIGLELIAAWAALALLAARSARAAARGGEPPDLAREERLARDGRSTRDLRRALAPVGGRRPGPPGLRCAAGGLTQGLDPRTVLARGRALVRHGLLRAGGLGPRRAGIVALAAWLALGTVVFSAQADMRPRYLEAFTPAIAACLALAVRARPAWLPLGAVLAASLAVSLGVVRAHAEDSGSPGALPAARVARLGAFLRARQQGARYEFASVDPSPAAPVIAADGRPVLILMAAGHEIVGVRALSRLVDARAVHDALVPRSCAAPVCAWIKAHGRDVSRAAGQPHAGRVYALGGRMPERSGGVRSRRRRAPAARQAS